MSFQRSAGKEKRQRQQDQQARNQYYQQHQHDTRVAEILVGDDESRCHVRLTAAQGQNASRAGLRTTDHPTRRRAEHNEQHGGKQRAAAGKLRQLAPVHSRQ